MVEVLKEYDLIVIGSGSGMELGSDFIHKNPESKIAVIDKDEPGGICLTRGCIPSKLLIYPSDVVRLIQKAHVFGIQVEIKKIDSLAVMARMRSLIDNQVNIIRNGLSNSSNLDYYQSTAEFVAPYTIKVGDETMTSKMIFLSTGSRPFIPPITGLEEAGYLTSDTLLRIKQLPKSIAIIGAGYIAAEYGHFFSAMGLKVIIIGRNQQFIPQEEPEISALAKREMQKRATILTGHEVRVVEKTHDRKKKLIAVDKESKKETVMVTEEIFVAAGRMSNNDILHPEKAGVKTDERGFLIVNEYLETTQPGIWVAGDVNGKFMFKNVANYESQVVYSNAILKNKVVADYHAVPHAVFCEPEIASVGLKETQAIAKYGNENLLIGFEKYADTARGEAMDLEDEFVKVIVEKETGKIVGCHIIGPQASVLIQEVVNLMYVDGQSLEPLVNAMHIHPALTEVVARAFRSLIPIEHYHHTLQVHLRL